MHAAADDDDDAKGSMWFYQMLFEVLQATLKEDESEGALQDCEMVPPLSYFFRENMRGYERF